MTSNSNTMTTSEQSIDPSTTSPSSSSSLNGADSTTRTTDADTPIGNTTISLDNNNNRSNNNNNQHYYYSDDNTCYPRPLLRVLCLHDANSDALELQESLELLGDRLAQQYGIDLVYVNSPLAVMVKDDKDHDDDDHDDHHKHHKNHPYPSREPRRVWWHDASETTTTKTTRSNEKKDNTNSVPPEKVDDQKQQQHEEDQPTLPPSHHLHPPQRHVRIDEDEDDTDIEDDLDHQSPDHPTSAYHSMSSPSSSSSSSSSYIGLDASLLLLQQVWTTGPFWGLLGVGQGGTLASILALLPTTFPPPQFLIFVQADSLLLREQEEEAQEQEEELQQQQKQKQQHQQQYERLSYIPALHLGSTDRLVAQFGGQVHPRKKENYSNNNNNNASSVTIINKTDLNLMGRFLVAQKRALFGEAVLPEEKGTPSCTTADASTDTVSATTSNHNNKGAQIIALQNALYLAELQAADLIAEEIAKNPPAALMAVIRPSQVSGVWQGDKRRQFGQEEGGGAPCPSEFLLNREKRANNPNAHGPSRAHPSSNKDSGNASTTASSEST